MGVSDSTVQLDTQKPQKLKSKVDPKDDTKISSLNHDIVAKSM